MNHPGAFSHAADSKGIHSAFYGHGDFFRHGIGGHNRALEIMSAVRFHYQFFHGGPDGRHRQFDANHAGIGNQDFIRFGADDFGREGRYLDGIGKSLFAGTGIGAATAGGDCSRFFFEYALLT